MSARVERRSRRSRVALPYAYGLLSALLFWVSCTAEETARSEFRVGFACDADRDGADALALTVLRGGCHGTEIVYGARLQKGGKAPALPTLKPGLYGFVAEASRGSVVLASGCTEQKLPNKKGASVELRSASCEAGGEVPGPDTDAGQVGQDGGAEESDAGPCVGEGCDDNNPCTAYQCADGGCELVLLSAEMECDAIPCTRGDRCVQGLCVPGATDDALCADDNPCNAEVCVAGVGCSQSNLNGERCDDGVSCSEEDLCLNGRCWGQSSCAGAEVCDRTVGTCVTCTANAQCDDNDPCTEDVCSCQGEACSGGVCSHVPAADHTLCDDGTSCTVEDQCLAGVCQGKPDSARCNDRNDCTDDVCEVGTGCRFQARDRACDDLLECTTDDRCVAGACVGDVACGADAFCDAEGRCVMCEVDSDCAGDAGNSCVLDTCVQGSCVRSLRDGPCEDGIACTVGDTCHEGVCQPGAPDDTKCVDSDQCTADSCDPLSGCTHRLAPLDCDDGVACTTGDKCLQGACRGQNACGAGQICLLEQNVCVTCLQDSDCEDGRQCTQDVCRDGVCEHTNLSNVGCNDGTACSTNDRCVDGVCVGTPNHALCATNNECVSGVCTPGVGCTTAFNTQSCNDGKSCTSADTCSQGQCVGTNTCSSGAVCQTGGCLCTNAGETLCGSACVNLATSSQHCGECGYVCGSGKECVAGACRPTSAPALCVASRWRGHDYLVCNDTTYNWNQARTRCRNFGMDLPIISDVTENNHLRVLANGRDRWIGANDKGDNGSNCRRSGQEGRWRWIEPAGGGLAGSIFCEHANSNARTCTARDGMYVNWRSDEPNNSGCGSCPVFGFGGDCSEGEDCGMLYATDGTWNDAKCGSSEAGERRYYICESY